MSKGLGKGLSALMAEDYGQDSPVNLDKSKMVTMLPINDLTSGKYQPRHQFDETALKELSESIASNGVMQPIIVRTLDQKRNGAGYEIIAGERRWRASKMAGLLEVPVLIRDIGDKKALEMALIENIQRQDLNSLEEAEGYQLLMDGFSYKQEELSKVVGKSRSHIANSLRLLSLPDDVKDGLKAGNITAGHARALVKAENPKELMQEIVKRGLNVRQTENLVKAGGLPPDERIEQETSKAVTKNLAKAKSKSSSKEAFEHPKDPDILTLEETIEQHLGMRVDIRNEDERGEVTITYESLSQLDTLLRRLGGAI